MVIFELKDGYRGPVEGRQVEVGTGFGGGDCGYPFEEGREYLVYARANGKGKLDTSICSRTRLLTDAADDLKYFARKDDPAHGAGIEGWIDEQSRGTDNQTEVIGPLRGARVRIEGKSGKWIVRTDENGRFRQWGLAPGTYRVIPEFPSKFAAEVERTVVLQPQSCEEVRFLATPPSSAAPRREG